jgi:hydroxymethylglutaryl-CoA synthase
VGYGRGVAAVAFPLTPVVGGLGPARRSGFWRALDNAIDLNRQQYEALHDGAQPEGLDYSPRDEFRITRVGERYEQGFQDLGVEYYEYVP